MPIRWFQCPDGGKTEIADCLKEGGCRMGNRCATPAYLRMAASDRPWTGKPSTTQLISGTRQAWLKITKDYSVYPDGRAFMIHGTRAHKRLEEQQDDFSITEGRLDGDDVPITGIFDSLITESGWSILVEYKTSGSFMLAKALGWRSVAVSSGGEYKSGPRKGQPRTHKVLKQNDEWIDCMEWELQLNHYRIGLEKRGYHIDELRAQVVVRDGNTWIARSRGVYRNVYYFPIKMLDNNVVLSYFNHKREALLTALKVGHCESMCNARETWGGIKCERYCEVAEFCPLGKYIKKEREREAIYMPIVGLTDKFRFDRMGKIRLGEKRTNDKGKEYPYELHYFKLAPGTPSEEHRDALIAEFKELYGEEPTRIKIMFPVSDPEIIMPTYLKRYTKAGLQCKGDNVTAICMNEKAAKGLERIGDAEGMIEVKCDKETCPYYVAKDCKQNATVNVLLPDMPGLGVWQIVTGSTNSINNIIGALTMIQAKAGHINMIPVWLERREEETPSPEAGKQKHYIMHIDSDLRLADLQRVAQLKPSEVMLELPAAEGLDTEEPLDAGSEEVPEQDMEPGDDTIDFPTEEEMAAEREAERAAMESELGKDDNGNGRGAKMQELTELVKTTPMKTITKSPFKNFAKKVLGKPGFPLSELDESDLDMLIEEINNQNNANADKNAEEQDLPLC